MQTIHALFAAAAVALAPTLSRAAEAIGPEEATALGTLVSLGFAAEAAKDQCSPHLANNRAGLMHQHWLERNGALLAKVDAAGSKGPWSSDGPGAQEVWQELKASQVTVVQHQVEEMLTKPLASSCDGLVNSFERGEFDLTRFPDQLRTLAIQRPQ